MSSYRLGRADAATFVRSDLCYDSRRSLISRSFVFLGGRYKRLTSRPCERNVPDEGVCRSPETCSARRRVCLEIRRNVSHRPFMIPCPHRRQSFAMRGRCGCAVTELIEFRCVCFCCRSAEEEAGLAHARSSSVMLACCYTI